MTAGYLGPVHQMEAPPAAEGRLPCRRGFDRAGEVSVYCGRTGVGMLGRNLRDVGGSGRRVKART
jgi:hypothetical protein